MSREFSLSNRDSRLAVIRRFEEWNLTRSAPELAGPTAGVTTLKLTRDGFNLHFNPTYFPGSMRSLLVVKCRFEEHNGMTILSARIRYELIPMWSFNFIVLGVLGWALTEQVMEFWRWASLKRAGTILAIVVGLAYLAMLWYFGLRGTAADSRALKALIRRVAAGS